MINKRLQETGYLEVAKELTSEFSVSSIDFAFKKVSLEGTVKLDRMEKKVH